MLERYAQQALQIIRSRLGTPQMVQLMERAASLKGGWEGWLQVEIALALAAGFGGIVEVDREVPYADLRRILELRNLRTDVFIDIGDNEFILMEIKAESKFQETSFEGSLARRYVDDAGKLLELSGRGSRNVLSMVLGFCATDAADRALRDLLARFPGLAEKTFFTDLTAPGATGIRLYYSIFR